MDGVVKKNKKPLLAKIIDKVKGKAYPSEQRNLYLEVPNDDHTEDVVNAIELRRDELRALQHGNADAVVSYENSELIE